MHSFCGNCFNETLNDQQCCTLCGFDAASNRKIAPHALPAGTILNGRYIVGKILGQGGFGITYAARDHHTGQLMAVKEFYPDSMVTRTNQTEVSPFEGERGDNFAYGKETFLQEAETMAQFIGNENIVRVYSYFEENSTAYFVMEYVDGISFLEHLKSRGGKISVEEALSFLYPVMDALSVVHGKNIIHRDVTPDNIYISKDGVVKLLDFGAARYSLGNASRSLDVILKHGFAPREQYKRRGRQGPFTDVYSLGATLYYAITGIRPDDALERLDEDIVAKPSALGVQISKAQEAALMKAMAVDPEKRFQTMAEFRDAMKRAEPKTKPKLSENVKPIPEKIEKPKKKALWLIPAAAALVCIVGAVLVLGRNPDPALSVPPAETATVPQTAPEVTSDVTPATVSLTLEEASYNAAVDLFYQGEYGKAAIAFGKLGDFRDAREISFKIWDAIAERNTIFAYRGCTLAIREDGTVAACGRYAPTVDTWENIVSLAIGGFYSANRIYALRSDGTVFSSSGDLEWTDIVAVCSVTVHEYDQYYDAYPFLLGLKSDGTIAATYPFDPQYRKEAYNNKLLEYQSKFESLTDVVNIYGNGKYIELSDGTILKDFEVVEVPDLIETSGYRFGSALLKKDGTVAFEINAETHFKNDQNLTDKIKSDTSKWTDIVAIAGSGDEELFGIKSDGTVVATGNNDGARPLDVGKWTDVVAVASSDCHAIALQSDGTVVTSGNSGLGERRTSDFKQIRQPADREALLAAIELTYIT